MNSFGPGQRQCRAPVASYRETRDNGRLQWRVTAKPGAMAGFGGGLLRNQGKRRAPVAGYRETRDNGGSSGGLLRNKGQRRCPVVGYCEIRDKGGLQ